MSKDKRKIRANFKKNRVPRARDAGLTRRFATDALNSGDELRGERLSGKGELSRKRTILGAVAVDDVAGLSVQRDVAAAAQLGRVLSVHGQFSIVEADDSGALFRCATRRVLKTMSTDQRNVVSAGDRVFFQRARPEAFEQTASDGSLPEGIIERVQPRYSALCRTVRGRQHVMVANVDQMIIVASAAEPRLKPGLIDRYLVCAEKYRLRPIVCINKTDLVDRADLVPLTGVFSRLGYRVLLISAATGFGVERLRRELAGRSTVIVGQSGVGKSSLLNAVDAGLALRVGVVSEENQKGKHTTTAARLLRLASLPGYVVDTPGIRQFALWDVAPAEVAGYFRDVRPFANRCKYPNCTHRHESNCAVKDAVADGWLDARRYESYCVLFEGDENV